MRGGVPPVRTSPRAPFGETRTSRTMSSSLPRGGPTGAPLGGRGPWSRSSSSTSSSAGGTPDATRRPARVPRRAPTRVVATLAASGAATAFLAPRRVVAGSHTTDAPVPEDAVHPEDDADVEDAAPPRVVAFFDLDHTIIDTNSNKHWVSREILAGRVTPKLIGLAIYWFTRYAMGQGAGAEAAGAEAAMAYAGKSERELRAEVETMFDDKLAHRMRPGCGPTMAEHVARGELCVMCTSSWQYAAQYAARLFGCETAPEMVISSVMEEKGGKLTGGIEKVAYGDGKYHVTKAWADANGVDLSRCYFYSDSMSDVLLLEMVGHPVVVNPDPKLRAHAEKRGWEIRDWGKAPEKNGEKRSKVRARR